MNKKTFQIFFIIVMTSHFYGFSQELWSIEDCIAYALENNLEQENQTYNTEIEKEQWQQAKRDLIPQINVGLPSYTVNYGRRFDDIANTTVDTRTVSGVNGSLSTYVVLFESFKRWNTLTYKKIQFQTSKQTMLQYKYDLAFKVMTLYNDVLFYKGNVEIVAEQQKLNLLLFKLINAQVALGIKAKSDLYEIEATISEDELNVLQAKNKLKESKLSLLQEMNLEKNDITLIALLDADKSSLFPELLDIETIFYNAQQSLPSLKISKYRIEAAKKSLAITRASLFPKLTFSAGVNTGYSPNRVDALGNQIAFWEQTRVNTNNYVSMSLNIPIFNNGSNRSSTKIARINVAKAHVQLQQQSQLVYKEIQKLLQKNEALLAEKQLNEKKIKLKELTFNIAQKKYKKDLITFYELQLASNALITAKQEQLQISIQLSIQKKSLDFYNGTFSLPANNLTTVDGY